MANETKPTPIPPAVQAKMREGQRQRHALATTPSANPREERVKK